MMFKEWLIQEGSKRPYAYHVTYLTNVDNIGQSSLKAKGGVSPWQKPHLLKHSEKGVFYCYDGPCVKNWVSEVAEQANNLSDNIVEDQLIPIILRFNLNRTKSQKDMLGDAEVSGSQYTTKEIPSIGLEMWTSREWIDDIDSDYINPDAFVNYESYGDDGYYELSTPYPMPPELT